MRLQYKGGGLIRENCKQQNPTLANVAERGLIALQEDQRLEANRKALQESRQQEIFNHLILVLSLLLAQMSPQQLCHLSTL